MADDPSSVLHFSNSDRESDRSRGEPCIVSGRDSGCKCPRSPRSPRRRVAETHAKTRAKRAGAAPRKGRQCTRFSYLNEGERRRASSCGSSCASRSACTRVRAVEMDADATPPHAYEFHARVRVRRRIPSKPSRAPRRTDPPRSAALTLRHAQRNRVGEGCATMGRRPSVDLP
jgi:hypothetical protein